MYTFLVVLMVLSAVLMCFVVMIQNSKGGGLSSAFASSNQIMGVRKTTDFIEKATWGLAVFMVVISVLTAHTLPTSSTTISTLTEEALKEQKTNPLTNPAGLGTPAQTPSTATDTTAN